MPVKGVVSRISEKEWEGRDGMVTLYSFQLEGDRKWYRTGTTRPSKFGITEGAYVSFSTKGNGNIDPDSVEKVDAEPPRRAPSVKAYAQGGGVSKDAYWANKEARDIEREKRYQSVDVPRMTFCGAQDAAVKVIELALANGAFKLPTKVADQLPAIVDAVNQVALDLARARLNSYLDLAEDLPASNISNNDNSEDESDDD